MNKNKTFISQIPKFQKNNYLIIYVHKYIFKIWSIISLVNHHVFMYFKGIRVLWADQYFVVVVQSCQKTQQFFLLISLDIHTLDYPLFCLFLICLSHPFFNWSNFHNDVFRDVVVDIVKLHDLGKEEENVFG